jgi:hypothetical protein
VRVQTPAVLALSELILEPEKVLVNPGVLSLQFGLRNENRGAILTFAVRVDHDGVRVDRGVALYLLTLVGVGKQNA